MKYFLLISVLLFTNCKGINDAEEEEGLAIDFDLNTWIENNTIPKYENLISFELISEYDENLDAFNEQKGEILPKNQVQIEKDSIIAVAYQTIPVGCSIIGNIVIDNDTVELIYDTVCHPKEILVSEEVKFKLRYVLKNDGNFDDKNWKLVSKNLIKKQQ